MEILGPTMPAEAAHRFLIQTYRAMGGSILAGRGANLGWGVALVGNRMVRWLIFEAGIRGECVALRMTQSLAEFRASAARPARSLLDGVPDAPGAEPRFFAADDDAAAAVEVSEVRLPPAETVERIESRLLGDGWIPARPTDGETATVLFRRGRELCAVSAVPSDGGSVVTRMRKVLGRREAMDAEASGP